ncbi:Npt1/Npt2 family nucleotide transporter [Candidatus Dependentiae bacterium]
MIIKRITELIKKLRSLDKETAKKIIYLSSIYALLIFTYSTIRPIKDAIFLAMVGAKFQPIAKLAVMAFSPFFIIFYSAIVTRMNRKRASMSLIGGYAAACIALSLACLHPVLGILNTITSPFRILGWTAYALFDMYPLAVMTCFWALTSSISTPDKASTQYGIMSATSRLGGIIASGFGYIVMKSSMPVYATIPALTALSGTMLFATTLLIKSMFKNINKENLKGYTDQKAGSPTKRKKPGLLEGLKAVVREPYAFGIFTIFCSYELISALATFRTQCLITAQTAHSMQKIGSYVFGYTFIFQSIGFFIALFGTTTLPKKLGMKISLLITPAILFIFSAALIGNLNLYSLTAMMIAMKALNYGFNIPVREMLFIPTSRNIQFMAKGWIDSFGKTFSKATGSVMNLASTMPHLSSLSVMLAPISLAISAVWGIIAMALGNKFQNAVKKSEVIGQKQPKKTH